MNDASASQNGQVAVLHFQAEALIAALATCQDPQAFQALLALNQRVGMTLGESARLLAQATSWTSVGEACGMSKQAAWARWRGD